MTIFTRKQKERAAAGAAGVLLLIAAHPAFAAVGTGNEFNDLYDLISGWATGSLGKALSCAFLLVGLGMGLVRGSVVAAVTAIGAAVALLVLPNILDAMFTVAS